MSEKEIHFNNLLRQLVENYNINNEDELKNALTNNKLYIDIFTQNIRQNK